MASKTTAPERVLASVEYNAKIRGVSDAEYFSHLASADSALYAQTGKSLCKNFSVRHKTHLDFPT